MAILVAVVYWVYKYCNDGFDENTNDLLTVESNSCFVDDAPALAVTDTITWVNGTNTWVRNLAYWLFFGTLIYLILSLIILCYRKAHFPNDQIHLTFVHYFDNGGIGQGNEALNPDLSRSALDY